MTLFFFSPLPAPQGKKGKKKAICPRQVRLLKFAIHCQLYLKSSWYNVSVISTGTPGC